MGETAHHEIRKPDSEREIRPSSSMPRYGLETWDVVPDLIIFPAGTRETASVAFTSVAGISSMSPCDREFASNFGDLVSIHQRRAVEFHSRKTGYQKNGLDTVWK